MAAKNIDQKTVDGFGSEWAHFDQRVQSADHALVFEKFFLVFPWHRLPEQACGFDLGCGSGRWARLVAPRVGTLHCIDPSPKALNVARDNLKEFANCRFHLACVDEIPLDDDSMDFGYALGVLHHIPDPQAGLRDCVRKLKPEAPLLIYMYYAFDNRPAWFPLIWRISNLLRLAVCRLPFTLRYAVSQLVAVTVYWPLARLSGLLEKFGREVEHVPLSFYRHRDFYGMRTDALDRLGTRVEKRFTAAQIRRMMEAAGLGAIEFSDSPPYWCAVGYKTASAGRS
ncbi:MAG: Methyltransferase type 11 [Microvirga sp.]|jgi:ubiquinone/menaquinone biosynthesis C-methylase UbiE|nr:Methyltransferase type 11 [Microvirga sp.]